MAVPSLSDPHRPVQAPTLPPEPLDLSGYSLPAARTTETSHRTGGLQGLCRGLSDGALSLIPFLAMLLPPGSPPPAGALNPGVQPPAAKQRMDAGVPAILASVDDAIALAEQKRIVGPVRETENSLTGNFSYELSVSAGAGVQKTHLRGVRPGDERARLLTSLGASGTKVEPDVFPPASAQPAAGSGFFDRIDIGTVLTGVIAFAMVAGLVMHMRARREMRRMSGGGSPGTGGRQVDEWTALGKHKGDILSDRPTQRFADVGGCPHVIAELEELKADIQSVINGDKTVYLPRGMVMSGGPGVGKTMLARALAGEVSVPFIHFDSSQFTQMLKGTGPARVKSGFEEARKLRDEMTFALRYPNMAKQKRHQESNPYARMYEEQERLADEKKREHLQGVCIMFFDEFDSIGSKRDVDGPIGNDDERKNIVNALLNEMDGLDKERNKNIIVVAATNFRDNLDGALMRPGRFTKKIDVPLPSSATDRLEILEKLSKHLIESRGKSLEEPGALGYIAKITPGKSGDDLRAILEESIAIARRDKRDRISTDDLFEAYQRLSFGRERKDFLAREKRELVAHHEHGHALAAMACGIGIFIVSMQPRGESGGRVVIDPEGLGEVLATRRDMLARVLLAAGGRAAETEAYGPQGITQGASMDLRQIRGLVRSMLSTGMLEGMYALEVDGMAQSQLKPEHISIIDRVTNRALDVAGRIVREVGNEKMNELVRDSLSMERELVGAEAREFFDRRLGDDLKARIATIASGFFDDPLAAPASTSRTSQPSENRPVSGA